jgi:hypothetical protein
MLISFSGPGGSGLCACAVRGAGGSWAEWLGMYGMGMAVPPRWTAGGESGIVLPDMMYGMGIALDAADGRLEDGLSLGLYSII